MAVFVRSSAELPRAHGAVEAAGLLVALLDDDVKTIRDRVSIGTCDDELIPLQARIEAVTDEGDLEEVYG